MRINPRHFEQEGTEGRFCSVLSVSCCAILLFLLCLTSGFAHEVRPAYLELRETAPETYDVLWKVPANGEMRLALYVRFPAEARQLSEPRGMFSGGAHIERWRIQRPGGLDGQSIAIEGLSSTKIDALVRVTDVKGVTQTFRATPDEPSVIIAAAASGWQVARTYTALGIEHILLGIDHLLFVLALVLLVKGWRRLVGTITAFTVAHSLTLAAATLGLVHVPGPPVEACIALSIVFVAAEILRSRAGNPGLTERAPWVVAFTFGLLHGLGFAGALTEVGLPQHAIPLSLLFFNVGVELGQLAFIAAVLAITALARRVPLPLPRWAHLVPPYVIGSVAMFWVIERIAAF
ncbi:MAG: HupE / UreJ protein [Verrucomicrobia bacterium]|nr:MAG: HupE / UreJ protein [Verrucomicrobiota bacterium]